MLFYFSHVGFNDVHSLYYGTQSKTQKCIFITVCYFHEIKATADFTDKPAFITDDVDYTLIRYVAITSCDLKVTVVILQEVNWSIMICVTSYVAGSDKPGFHAQLQIFRNTDFIY